MDNATQGSRANSFDLTKHNLPSGPNGLARRIEARMADLEERRKECRRSSDRAPLNERLNALDELLGWCKTREGYRADDSKPV